MADFFLEPDDAKTFGDIDYMRKVKRVKRTFAKTLGQPNEPELDIQVSAMDFKKEKAGNNPLPPSGSTESANGATFDASTNGFVAKPDEAVKRRQADSSMDIFRNMAKQIKK